MYPQRFALAGALCVAACAQIAGFEDLPYQEKETTGQGGSTAGRTSATNAGHSSAGDSNGPSFAGTSGSSSGGAFSGSGQSGALVSAGKGGASAGGGGAPAAAGSTANGAGSAGTAAVSACNTNLLRNADFDAGPLEWRQESRAPGILEPSDLIIQNTNQALTMANVAPVSGQYLAWLGGVLDSDRGSHTSLVQEVQIPAKVSKLVLSGYVQIKSSETDPQVAKDQLDLTLQDDEMYWSFHFWKGTEVTSGWLAFSYAMGDGARLDALRGRTLSFYAEAIADTEDISSFWLDSLSLVAECPH
jgi:hypothetical protein